MRMDLYIARRFLSVFARVFFGLLAVMIAINVIEELRRFSGAEISLRKAFELSLFKAPASIYQILPLIVLLSAIGLFMGLARSSELVVVRASGRSGLRFLLAPVLTSVAIGLIGVTVWNPISAVTAGVYDRMQSGQSRDDSVLSVNSEGLWLRQGSATGQTVIQAQRASLDGTELFDVSFLGYGPDGTLDLRVSGQKAVLGSGAWAVSGAKTWMLTDTNPERAAQISRQSILIPTDLTPDKIADSFGTPQAISIWKLPRFITELESAGFSGQAHKVWFNIELAAPAFLAGMVLIAAGFTMRHVRGGRTGPLILIALICGFLIFFLRNFGQVLGDNAQIPILMAAWSPPLIAILFSVGLLLHLEDG
jgi:lipopolysaccharide export system permease protein